MPSDPAFFTLFFSSALSDITEIQAFEVIRVVGVGIERADEEAGAKVDVGDGYDREVSEAELGDADGVEGMALLEVVLEDGDGDGVVDRRRGKARAEAGAEGFGAVVAEGSL